MNTLYLVYPKKLGTIAPEIYGHFSEHIGGVFYDGLWVGKDSDIPNVSGFRKELVEKLKAIEPPVLRWPGGCFAEAYDWRDGIGEDRPTRPNWWTPYDNRYESNEIGTHEFAELCELIGAKAYFAANLTSTTPLHVRNWMDYCLSPRGTTTLAKEREKNGHPEPFDIPYWGVGNENWGDGGNMTPEYYANEYRRFATVMWNVSPMQMFACGSNAFDYSWTDGFCRNLVTAWKRLREKITSGFSMHYYCGQAGDPLTFTETEWDQMMVQAGKMEDIIERNWHIISGYGLDKNMKLVIDEWGCWHPDGSGPSKGYNLFEQQSTMRDAVVSALTLNIFNRHCDKIKMANVAQLVNNLHALFLASGEHCITTPTYHIFDMYKGHKGADAIEAIFSADDGRLSVSASEKDGKTLVTIANLTYGEDIEITLSSVGCCIPGKGTVRVLAAADPHAHNTFEEPEAVKPVSFQADLTKPVRVPAAGVAAVEF